MVIQLQTEHKKLMISTTMGIVMVTTLVLSALLHSFTRFVGLNANQSQTKSMIEDLRHDDENEYKH
jgi:hypothetical protein